MERYTVLIKNNGKAEKIVETQTKIDAVITAWDAKMNGRSVIVVDGNTLEIVYR